MRVRALDPIYLPSVAGQLRQGEILSGVERFFLDLDTFTSDQPAFKRDKVGFAIVATQGCDLESDYRGRETNRPEALLSDVLLCRLSLASSARTGPGVNGTVWDQAKKNKHERYHFFQRIQSREDSGGEGMDELTADFKHCLTMPMAELLLRISSGAITRRCYLASPYLEHFSSRFAYFLGRVGLEHNHVSE
jgi:hypothetical protein